MGLLNTCKLKNDLITVDIEILYIEMLQIKHGQSPEIETNIFTQETQF